jgi:hypothetical protein
MAFVPISNAAAAELRFLYLGSRQELTLGFLKNPPVEESDLEQLADALADWWYNYLRPYHSSSLTHTEVYVRDLTSETSGAFTSTKRTGVVGSGTPGTLYPPNVSYCVSFRTGLRGRANRGRNYCLSMGSNYASATTVTSAFRNAMILAYQRLLPGGAADPTPWFWCVLSRQLDKVVGGRAVPIVAVTVADDYVDSMRRRLFGRGV